MSEIPETKSYAKARAAFGQRDVDATRLEHSKPTVNRSHERHGGSASEYIKSIVFGGLDGIMTTFAITTAAAGVGADYKTILILGLSNKIADAFAMGFGEYVSGNAERDFAMAERQRESWEVENCFDMEIQELVDVYVSHGIPEPDAIRMVSIVSKDPKVFVDFMMVDELQLLVDLDDVYGPLKQGIVMFFSFITFGIIPLLAYFSGHGKGMDSVFAMSVLLTAIALIILGAIKGHLTDISMFKAALTMVLNGVVSGIVSYSVGLLMQEAVGGGEISMSS